MKRLLLSLLFISSPAFCNEIHLGAPDYNYKDLVEVQELRVFKELENKFLRLNNETLHEFDGVFGLFDGYTVGGIGIVMQNIKARLMGVKTSDGQFDGWYSFRDGKYTLWQLESMEMHKEFTEKEHFEIVEQAKKEFSTFIKPFMARLNIAKNFVIVLMKESCTRRGVPNSFMLSWSRVNDNELQVFHAEMKTFQQMNKFFEELYYFLGDLAYSCPKGRTQAQKLKAEGKL